MNLATNCSKHVLAELKHFHSKDLGTVQNPQGTDRRCIPQIPPPPWKPAVLSNLVTGNEAPLPALVNGDLGNDSDEDASSEDHDDSGHAGGLMSVLGEIDQQVERASKIPKRGSVHVAEYIEAIGALSQSCESENKSLEPVRGKPRGNHGFFAHLRDQRALLPRQPDEAFPDYQSRLRAEARRTWDVTPLVFFADTGDVIQT